MRLQKDIFSKNGRNIHKQHITCMAISQLAFTAYEAALFADVSLIKNDYY